MKMNEDNKTVAAMDCLVPGIGEIIGGSQREDDIEKLEKRMDELGLKKEDSKNPYLLKASSHKLNILNFLLLQILFNPFHYSFHYFILIFFFAEKSGLFRICKKTTLYNIQNTFTSF